jgi:hypothetical protein
MWLIIIMTAVVVAVAIAAGTVPLSDAGAAGSRIFRMPRQ